MMSEPFTPSDFNASPSPQRISLRSSMALMAALIIALMMRVHCLLFPCLWLDEYVTLWSIGGEDYRAMLDRSLHWTASGPLFVLSYRLSCDLIGSVDWGIKLPGIIGGTASVWVAWWLARRLFLRNEIALATAWFVALAPQFVHFSQEARPYMLGTLQVMLATGFLAEWLRTGRKRDLIGTVIFSVTAVGFHLFAALALIAYNGVALVCAIVHSWSPRRWIEWIAAQCAIAFGLCFAGAQLWFLGQRHGSMIVDTELPMATVAALGKELNGKLFTSIGFLASAAAIAFIAIRFPSTRIGQAMRRDREGLMLAAASYIGPTVLVTALSLLQVLDCWPRYYFLFQTGFLLCLAWLLFATLPATGARVSAAILVLAMLTSYNRVGGLWSCRLTGDWLTFPQAQNALRERVGPSDLVVSRAGLIEANHLEFLTNPVGSSYLKCFCEAKDGPLLAEHLPLPFSPERESVKRYIRAIIEDRIAQRDDFWLVNMGPQDFDYRDWLTSELGGSFEMTETIEYRPFFVLTHFVRRADQLASVQHRE